jgi:16S rRNA (guanine527-N7)-methyltransferase
MFEKEEMMNQKAKNDYFPQMLALACSTHGINLSDIAVDLLHRHYLELMLWRKAHNLVSTKASTEDLVYLHYLDCLCALERVKSFVDQEQLTDVGTGAGFPGIVAAIAWPTCKVRLIESSQKKCDFLRLVCAKLGLKTVTIENVRADDAKPSKSVITRAAFSPGNLEQLIPIVENEGTLVLMSGINTLAPSIEALKKHHFKMIDDCVYALRGPVGPHGQAIEHHTLVFERQ